MASIITTVVPGNTQQTKDSMKETEEKVAKILSIVRNNIGPDKKGKIPEDSKKRSELIGLIEEFHKQYQSLNAQYDHLKGKMLKKKKKKKKKKEKLQSDRKEKESSSASSSDSEYYSPKEMEENQSTTNPNKPQSLDKTNEELFETGNPEGNSPRHKTSSKKSGKEALNLEVMAALGRLQEGETISKYQKKNVDESNGGLAALVKVHESHGSKASAQIKELEGQLTMMKIELESVRNEKKGLEDQLENKTSEIQKLGEKNLQHIAHISELELMSKNKEEEISTIVKKLRDNEKNLTAKTKELMEQVNGLQSEVESFRAQRNNSEEEMSTHVKVLKEQVDKKNHEMDSLQSKNLELEIQLEMKNKQVSEQISKIKTLEDELNQNTMLEHQETKKLKEEKENLNSKIQELEGQILTCQNNKKNGENEASSQVTALKEEVNNLKQASDTLREANANQKNILKEKELTIKKLSEESKPAAKHYSTDSPKLRSLDCRTIDYSGKLSQQGLEKKMEELAGRFHMKMENHIRLVYQRILVAEQIQVETKESFKKVKESLDQEHKELNEKIQAWEIEVGKMKHVLSEPGNNQLSGLDLVARKLDMGSGKFLNRISIISDELLFATNWIKETNNKMKELQEKVGSLTGRLKEKQEEMWELEVKLSETEKKRNAINQLEKMVGNLERELKEKEEVVLGLSEEKKEAIRQLCLLIDYHRNRYDHLKEEVSKINVRTLRRSAA